MDCGVTSRIDVTLFEHGCSSFLFIQCYSLYTLELKLPVSEPYQPKLRPLPYCHEMNMMQLNKSSTLTHLGSLVVAASWLLLSGCQPADDAERLTNQELALVQTLDQQQLPNQDWALSSAVIQLSFCRNRVNDALLAEGEELNRWRLVGERSAFPRQRQEGLEQLAELYHDHGVLLWQQWGTVSSQLYRIVYPSRYSEPNVFNALASLGRDEKICFSSLDASQSE